MLILQYMYLCVCVCWERRSESWSSLFELVSWNCLYENDCAAYVFINWFLCALLCRNVFFSLAPRSFIVFSSFCLSVCVQIWIFPYYHYCYRCVCCLFLFVSSVVVFFVLWSLLHKNINRIVCTLDLCQAQHEWYISVLCQRKIKENEMNQGYAGILFSA